MLLGVVFVTLKLLGITEVATWSWWWVTAPFWGVLALLLGILAVALLCAGSVIGVSALIDYHKHAKFRKQRQARNR